MSHQLDKIVIANAAGMVKTQAQAGALLGSAVNRIVVGSIKTAEWAGNLGETDYYDPETRTMWNSKGLPGQGMLKTRDFLFDLQTDCRIRGKELVVSIAESSPEASGHLAQELVSFVDRIKWNGGCPNVWGKEGQKPIPSYHPELLRANLLEVNDKVRGRKPISVKISPVPDELLDPLAQALNECREFVDEVVAVNTLPNQSGKRADGSEALSFRETEDAEVKHAGGMSGAPLKPHGLRVVKGLRERLDHRIKIIGCGGIFDGQDALDYLDAGADGFAVGTAFFQHGPHIFSDILADAVERNEE
jgi:dihydroorotate dehydrogenase